MFNNNNLLSIEAAGLLPFDGCNVGAAEAYSFELNEGLIVTIYTDGTPAEYYLK